MQAIANSGNNFSYFTDIFIGNNKFLKKVNVYVFLYLKAIYMYDKLKYKCLLLISD